MAKSIVEPMFGTMLPAPANSLHFTKLDLGSVPLKFANVDVHKTEQGAIKLDLDVDWDGDCDIDLTGNLMPTIGIERLKLTGRLSILLGPLTNVMPLIGAAQVAFINPPYLKFTYTNAGAIANVGFIDGQIRGIIQSVIAGMAVLPNRFLVKLDANTDWFQAYQHPLGVLRLTVDSATNIGADKTGKGFLGKLTHDVPDAYVKVNLGEDFKTKTIQNDRNPTWNESHDFLLCDHDQVLSFNVVDSDTTSDDHLGTASVSSKDVLLAGGAHELALSLNGAEVEGKLKVVGKYLQFVPDATSLSSQDPGTHGLLTVLIAYVKGISGDRAQLKPSVAVTWGESAKFRTGIHTDSPGSDIQNPSFDAAFRVPLTAAVTVAGAPPVRIALMDGEKERGFVEVPLEEVVGAPDLVLVKEFALQGDAAVVRASIIVRGTKAVE